MQSTARSLIANKRKPTALNKASSAATWVRLAANVIRRRAPMHYVRGTLGTHPPLATVSPSNWDDGTQRNITQVRMVTAPVRSATAGGRSHNGCVEGRLRRSGLGGDRFWQAMRS